eukprot:1187-Heterococcus_DN1.PRE.1
MYPLSSLCVYSDRACNCQNSTVTVGKWICVALLRDDAASLQHADMHAHSSYLAQCSKNRV